MRAALAVLVAVLLAGCGATDETTTDDTATPQTHAVRAADGTPLARLPGTRELSQHLTRVKAQALAQRDVKTAISPALQRVLVRELGTGTTAGVVVEVRTGRVLAAAGSDGRSPWRSTHEAGATIDPILEIGTRANRGARLASWNIDELLRRVGFDRRPRATDLRTLVPASRGARMTSPGGHGNGAGPELLDEHGRPKDPGGPCPRDDRAARPDRTGACQRRAPHRPRRDAARAPPRPGAVVGVDRRLSAPGDARRSRERRLLYAELRPGVLALDGVGADHDGSRHGPAEDRAPPAPPGPLSPHPVGRRHT